MGRRMIVGTAGHVDHGKSALVTALTGRTMDRLAEERRRGITIDLNFAPLALDDGRIAGVIDVPGHEDFVRTMVAGASSVDVALLVVAADEGIMPQTIEHLLVLERLGVPRGIPVLSKADLVDADWLALVRAELCGRLARSTVLFEPPVAVSVRSGIGIAALRAALTRMLADLAPRERDDLFRMPVDRAFSAPGIGTVVAGTCWSGSIEVGAEVRILPGGARGKVRSIETHGVPVGSAEPGARTALGLASVHRDAVARGAVVVSAESPWEETSVIDVLLGLDQDDGLRRRTRIRVHLGTADVSAWVAPRGAILGRGTGMARLTLDRPVVARGGDRFVVRSLSPVAMLGGGTVLDPLPERRAVWPDALASAEPDARLEALVQRRRAGIAAAVAPVLSGIPRRTLDRLLRDHATLRRAGEHLVSVHQISAARARAAAALEAYHRANPANRGMPLEALRRAAGPAAWIAEAAIAGLREAGAIQVQEGLVAARTFRPSVAGGDAIVAEVIARLERAALEPPSVSELAALSARPDIAAVLRVAASAGSIEPVERDRYYARTALEEFARALRASGESGDISVARLRDSLGLSRKFLIPLLEWADRKGITVRIGDTRRLRAPAGGAGRTS